MLTSHPDITGPTFTDNAAKFIREISRETESQTQTTEPPRGPLHRLRPEEYLLLAVPERITALPVDSTDDYEDADPRQTEGARLTDDYLANPSPETAAALVRWSRGER